MSDQERRLIARYLGLPDKAVTPELAAQYEIREENGQTVVIAKEE